MAKSKQTEPTVCWHLLDSADLIAKLSLWDSTSFKGLGRAGDKAQTWDQNLGDGASHENSKEVPLVQTKGGIQLLREMPFLKANKALQ